MSQQVLFDVHDVAARYSVSAATVRTWAASGAFPAPIRPSRNIVRWRLEDLEAWERTFTEAPLEVASKG